MKKGNILVLDDEPELRQLLAQLLGLEGYRVWEAGNAKDGLAILSTEDILVVVSDVRLPDGNGVQLIPRIKEISPNCEIIIITAYGTIRDGVDSMKSGAFDYITKGDDENKIVHLVQKAFEKALLKQRVQRLESKIYERYSFENIITDSEIMKETIALAQRVAVTDSPVLLLGETGAGKEVFAQAIHYKSNRRDHSFVAVNCSSFAKDLLEAEMFGYKAGAFTGAVKNKKGLFEEADHGTIFLDEIGDMEIGLQAKILRALEEHSFIKQGDTVPTVVDVRIIAATNRTLADEISKGSFRKDLYYRLSVVEVEIPPLRKRPEDIPLLIESFVMQFAQKMNKPIPEIDRSFVNRLCEYAFPGNIRELRNIIERALILNDGQSLTTKSLPKEFHRESFAPGEPLLLEEIEKQHILQTLEKADGNKQKAADLLGIGLTTLYRKLQTYGLQPKD